MSGPTFCRDKLFAKKFTDMTGKEISAMIEGIRVDRKDNGPGTDWMEQIAVVNLLCAERNARSSSKIALWALGVATLSIALTVASFLKII